jgi:hypothetical protein
MNDSVRQFWLSSHSILFSPYVEQNIVNWNVETQCNANVIGAELIPDLFNVAVSSA